MKAKEKKTAKPEQVVPRKRENPIMREIIVGSTADATIKKTLLELKRDKGEFDFHFTEGNNFVILYPKAGKLRVPGKAHQYKEPKT